MEKEKIILYGFGGMAREAIVYYSNKYEIICYTDSEPTKWGSKLLDVEVCNPNIISKGIHDHIIITSMYHDDIKKTILTLGVHPKNIILFANNYKTIGLKTPIFFNALGKSASSYISAILPRGLRLTRQAHCAGGAEPLFLLNQRLIEDAAKNYKFANHHLIANDYNKVLLNYYYDKIIVHVRDPRQATISNLYNIERNQREEPILNDILFLPEGYHGWSFDDKLNYQVQHRIKFNVNWIKSWLDAENDLKFKPEILFTTFEDFKNNNQSFVTRILDFYEVEHSNFNFDVLTPPDKIHLYRSGRKDEWREVFSEKQIAYANELLPQTFLNKFNWKY